MRQPLYESFFNIALYYQQRGLVINAIALYTEGLQIARAEVQDNNSTQAASQALAQLGELQIALIQLAANAQDQNAVLKGAELYNQLGAPQSALNLLQPYMPAIVTTTEAVMTIAAEQHHFLGQCYMFCGASYRLMQRYQDALLYFENSLIFSHLSAPRDRARILYECAKTAHIVKEYKKAYEYCSSTLDSSPESVDPRLTRAQIAIEWIRVMPSKGPELFPTALGDCNTYVTAYKEDAVGLLARGGVRDLMGSYREAHEDYKTSRMLFRAIANPQQMHHHAAVLVALNREHQLHRCSESKDSLLDTAEFSLPLIAEEVPVLLHALMAPDNILTALNLCEEGLVPFSYQVYQEILTAMAEGRIKLTALRLPPLREIQKLGMEVTLWPTALAELLGRAIAPEPKIVPAAVLTTLSVAGNKIGDNGIITLLERLNNNRHQLARLNLDDCEVGVRGGRCLGNALFRSAFHFVTLSLQNNDFGGVDTHQLLISGAIFHSTLRRFQITGPQRLPMLKIHNALGDIRNNSTLTAVELGFAKLFPEDKAMVDDILLRNQTRDIRVRTNWIRVGLILAFVRANQNNTFRTSIIALIPAIVNLVNPVAHDLDYLWSPNLQQLGSSVSAVAKTSSSSSSSTTTSITSSNSSSSSSGSSSSSSSSSGQRTSLLDVSKFMDSLFFRAHVPLWSAPSTSSSSSSTAIAAAAAPAAASARSRRKRKTVAPAQH